jgi:hypothetical protein
VKNSSANGRARDRSRPRSIPVSVRSWMLPAFVMCLMPRSATTDALLSVQVRPNYCQDPCHIEVTVRLDPHDTDRTLLVEADSINFYRSSTIQLDGLAGAAVHRVEFSSVPAGQYLVRVSLGRVEGVVARSDSNVLVVGAVP